MGYGPARRFVARLLVVAGAVGVGVWVWSQSSAADDPPTPQVCSTGKTVAMVVANPNGTVLKVPNVPWVQNMNVHLAMRNAQSVNPKFTFAAAYYCPYGSYVTTINGFYEGGSNYWALFVNGSYAQYGIDTQLLNAGDTFSWVVESTTAVPKDNRQDSHQERLRVLHAANRLDRVAPAVPKN
jgi:hypothetical protein